MVVSKVECVFWLMRYRVSAEVNGKRETLKCCRNLAEGKAFAAKVEAYVAGTYDNEVFSIINAIVQAQAEG